MRRSRAITWEEVKVGVMLIIALVLLAASIFFIGDMGSVFGWANWRRGIGPSVPPFAQVGFPINGLGR